MSAAAVIRIEAVSVGSSTRPILDRVSCSLDQPGLVVLAGPNGAGKSTLLRAIAGVIRPAAGRVLLAETDVQAVIPAARAKLIAYMPQDRTIHWNLPARAIVALGRLAHAGATSPSKDLDAIERALAAVDATHFAERPVLSLSGGERARILMARALAQDARVVLADEPAAGLDPAHQWALLETLSGLAARGVRVVAVLHDLALMSRFAAHVLLLDQGRVAASGSPSDVLAPARLAAVYAVATTNVDGMIVPTGRT